MTEKTCACGCGKVFDPVNARHRFASTECARAAYHTVNPHHKAKGYEPWKPSEIVCACGCGVRFTRRSVRHTYATDKCRYRAKKKSDPTPENREKVRARCTAWYAAKKPDREERPWLLGAPPFGEFLPGGAFSLSFAPALRWPMALRNARLLHGVLTALTAIPHHETMPMFTLIPMDHGHGKWAVWIADEAVARRLAGHAWPASVADQSVLVHCGPFARLRSPQVSHRGHQQIRVDMLTPITIRSMGGAVTRVNPTEGNLLSTISSWLPRRLGLDHLRLCFHLLEKRTETTRTDLGGKFGAVLGCQGYFVADVNAPCRWLLECAARGLGLGGRTAFGFGRIRITEADAKEAAA